MSTVVKDLGAATAYGYAVEKGYTGTEAEFAELMADYATVGQTAVTAAQTATTKASEAATSATTATTKASEATTAAQTATTKAGEASTSASTATSAKDTAVSAASTATSKATEATTAAATATSAKTDAVAANTAAQSAKTAAQTAQTGAETAAASVQESASQIAQNTSDISELKEDLTTLAPKEDMLKVFPTDTASGSVASFADGANVPVKSLIVNIDPVQSGSGDPSPTNVRPISGWSEVNTNVSGINVWDEEYEIGAINDTTGENIHNDIRTRSVNYIPVVPNAQYYPKKGNSASTVFVYWYNAEKTYLRHETQSWSYVVKTIPSDAYYMRFMYVGTTYDHDISINYPSTDHDYHPYNGQSITIDLGQTVYGGKLDVVSGVLTAYPYYASYNGETLTGEWVSDRDKYAIGATPTTGAQVVDMGGIGTTVQLTPNEVTALLGSNNVWADSGDSEVVYRADPTLYIQRLTEPDADMVADANITSGQYFMVGNTLYKATANIASGGAITPNVNCTRKSLSEALNELNA